jgi:alkylation response protein AidB-like acyl-CoA dehydrogenase
MAGTAPATRDEVMLAIDRVRPVIEHHRDEAERERRLSEAVIAAMQTEGLFDLCLPKEYGGAEIDFPAFMTAVEEVSRIDSAAGWTFANVACAGCQAALLPEAGASEVFGGRPVTAGSVVPRGHAVPEEGGYRVSGQWPLASGCHHASWLGGNCLVFDGDTPRFGPGGMPDFKLMFFPAAECAILDTWHSTGMRGTGSADIAVKDIFVPEERTFSIFTAQSRLPGALFKIHIDQLFFTALTSVTLGIARSAIDALVEIAKAKTPTLSQSVLSARPTVHAEVARAEALYQSARAYLHEVVREMMDTVSEGGEIPETLEARRRLACVNTGEACGKVVDMMYRLGGTTSIYTGQILDRCLRDMHTVNQHLAVSPVWWEKTGQYYFGLGLGMP